MVEGGVGVGGAITVGSSIRNVNRSYEGIWRARRIIRAGSPYFLNYHPFVKRAGAPFRFELDLL
jgi:hypothetical protein